jgi:serine/threonine protein kinase
LEIVQGNVLIDEKGHAKLCDFGLVKVLAEGKSLGFTTTTPHTGTDRYLAPELVFADESVAPTTASDIYALGCLGLKVHYLFSQNSME